MSKEIHSSEVHGKILKGIYLDEYARFPFIPTNIKLPSSKNRMTFDLKAAKRSWLVLDNYGDEVLTPNFRKILFLSEMWKNIAIDKQSGEIYLFTFIMDNKSIKAILSPILEAKEESAKVPKKYLPKLDLLKSEKRPYCLSLRGKDLIEYIEHEVDNQYLRNNIVVDINFPDETVQIWGPAYREAYGWEREQELFGEEIMDVK